ncbi:hypothetical protein SBO82_13425 [Alcaligenes nematophilus]|uniref:hypothetical protein n=1 Tax=Alcaligenes nematophilus TaxID=2994643 RepID=UPI00245EFC25|nr:hypothetical protein [Alcaligenes nematophilus]MDH4867963.1 hypothetical protein [Bacillus cereus]MDY7129275.1 hypothetical protein [Alcaligenes nematophilus]
MKPSWTDIAAFGLLLFFALVMANGWPSGDWALGWSAIGALGTIVTGGIAARIAYVQYKDSQLAVEKKRKHAQDSIKGKIGHLERCLVTISPAVTLMSYYIRSPESDSLRKSRKALMDFLLDDGRWPDLELSYEQEQLTSDESRSRLRLLKSVVHKLRNFKPEFGPSLSECSTSTDLLVALERTLIQVKEVADISRLLESDLQGRDGILTDVEDTLTSIRRLRLLFPTFASVQR